MLENLTNLLIYWSTNLRLFSSGLLGPISAWTCGDDIWTLAQISSKVAAISVRICSFFSKKIYGTHERILLYTTCMQPIMGFRKLYFYLKFLFMPFSTCFFTFRTCILNFWLYTSVHESHISCIWAWKLTFKSTFIILQLVHMLSQFDMEVTWYLKMQEEDERSPI